MRGYACIRAKQASVFAKMHIGHASNARTSANTNAKKEHTCAELTRAGTHPLACVPCDRSLGLGTHLAPNVTPILILTLPPTLTPQFQPKSTPILL